MKTNNTNKLMIVWLTLVLIAMPLAFAEENETPILISVDPIVDNSNLSLDAEIIQELNEDSNESVSNWAIRKAKFGLWFTFNQEKKAEKEFDLARLELIRARNFAKENDTIAMEKALEAHNILIEKVQSRIDSFNGKSTKDSIQESTKNLIGLERAIEVHELRIQRFKDLIANDLNLTEEQVLRIEEKISNAENNTDHLRNVQEAKREKIKTKFMAVGNLSEDEAEDELSEIEEEQNLSAMRKVIANKRLVEFEEHLKVLKEIVSQAQIEGKNVTYAQIRIEELEEAIQNTKMLIENESYDGAIDALKHFEKSRKELEQKIRKENRQFNEIARENAKRESEFAKEQIKSQVEIAKQNNQQIQR